LHFQLIEANGHEEVDPAIAAVVEQLRSLFRYEGYRLLGETNVTVANREAFQQRVMGTDGEYPFTLEADVALQGTDALRLGGIRLDNPWETLLETSVTISIGQTIVIGGGQDSGPPDVNRTVILTVAGWTQRTSSIQGPFAATGHTPRRTRWVVHGRISNRRDSGPVFALQDFE
jgi:hypothetical protein